MGHGPAFSILWSPIPLITWIMPFIGHMGVSTSSGRAVDFAGPYMVHEDEDGVMIFGHPTRYLVLDPCKAHGCSAAQGVESGQRSDPAAVARWWDGQVDLTIQAFQNQSYNILGNNCHALVAAFMNQVSYKNRQNWNMIQLAALVFICGRYTSPLGFLWSWAPFIIIATLGGYFGRLYFLYAWLGLTLPLVVWFTLYVSCLARQKPACRP